MTFKMFSQIIVYLALACVFGDDGLTVINLRHRSADTLIPMLRGLYGNQVTITGNNLKLIVRAPPAIVTEIRQLTSDLDRKPRMLRVAIRDASQGSAQASQIAVNGSLALGRRTGASNVRVVASNTESQQKSSGERFIMVEEGVPASLGDGTGSQIVARVEGERVSVQLLPAVPGVGGAATTDAHSLNTTTSAPAGQWVQLGGTSQTSQRSNSGLLNGAKQSNQSASQLLLKVDPQ